MTFFKKRWYHWFLPLILLTGFLVRYVNIMSLSAGDDHAFLIYWSRIVSEAKEFGLSRDLIHYLLHGYTNSIISLLLTQQDSLIYAILYGLYENPEKITRIIDVAILAVWFKMVGYGIFHARMLSILFQLGTVWMTYLLTLRISRSQFISFLSLILMAFLPTNVLFSRFVSWHTFGSFFFILTIYVMVIGFDKRIKEGKHLLFYLSSLLWGIAAISNTLIPFLIPLIVWVYLWIVVRDNLKEKIKIFLFWLWPGVVVLLPAFVFLTTRFQEFYQRNIRYDYWNQSLYKKIIIQLASWNDIMGLTLMICVTLGVILALKMVRENRSLSIPLLWLLFQFILFSFISTETLFRTHLNAIPPLVFFASFFIGSALSRVERKDLATSKKVYLRVGMLVILFILFLPNSVTLCKVVKNPYYNPFKYSNYESYLHPLKAESELVDFIEEKLPLGSVIFFSSRFIHSMNVQLSDKDKYTFVNLTALYLNQTGKNYKCHLKRFYKGYRENSPQCIVIKYSKLPLEYFKTLEPSAHFVLLLEIHDYKLYEIELPSHFEINGKTL